ncbi:hypothetical protein [Streptomyces sp. 2A115]|uniref:hypothetical protein n=1 Tax=Streptomyces sp. 2A115 TaxID=3457439 RepID=UPI003FD43572
MKAVVWHGVGNVRLEEVPEPVEANRRFDRREAGWTKVVLGGSDEGAVAPGLKKRRTWR